MYMNMERNVINTPINNQYAFAMDRVKDNPSISSSAEQHKNDTFWLFSFCQEIPPQILIFIDDG